VKIVLQRVSSASVTVDGEICGKIGTGYLVLLGVGQGDTEEDCRRLADKIINLRIFSDENGKTNLSIEQVKGELLIVSQFTLYANCKKGYRPSFIEAGKPDMAN
jgi:D-tyrosyl-tRNA(Tyr) deacylase